MKPLIRFFTYSFFLVFLNSCGQIFEVDADVQARQALLDLMKIQEKFYQENKRYATRFGEIEKYNLKYHSGIVYLEIESAGKDTYRAISLPAESTTARVFSYDSNQGGFYEMEGEEVSKYVLGALRHIRVQKQEKDLIELTGWMMIAGMCFLGLRFFRVIDARKTILHFGPISCVCHLWVGPSPCWEIWRLMWYSPPP